MYCLYCLNSDIVRDFDFEITVLKKRKPHGIYKETMYILYRILMVLEFTNRQPLALGSTVVGCLNPVISCKSQHYSIFN